jgi:hypothetical protein
MSYKDNNEVRDTKRQAKNLREFFASQGVDVPHTMALEAVSRLLGDKFWNVTRSKARAVKPRESVKAATVQALNFATDDAYLREEGQLRVWLEADWNFRGQFEVHVSHPLTGILGCQVKVWWGEDLVFEEWKQSLLDIVVGAVGPLLDESLVTTVDERNQLVFDVLEYCCVLVGTVESDVQAYVKELIEDLPRVAGR